MSLEKPAFESGPERDGVIRIYRLGWRPTPDLANGNPADNDVRIVRVQGRDHEAFLSEMAAIREDEQADSERVADSFFELLHEVHQDSDRKAREAIAAFLKEKNIKPNEVQDWRINDKDL